MEYLGAQGVGKSFFVYKYRHLDICLPRTEQKIGKGHKGFKVDLAKDEKEASMRRDFTVNALMYDIQNEQIIDFWQGLEDLERKMLRVVDEHAFVEDSLRVLRAMQLATRFGFKVEKKSCELCQGIALNDLPKERLFMEFEKMFRGTYLHYGLYYLFTLGIFEKLFHVEKSFSTCMQKKTFIALGRKLQRSQQHFVEKLRPYYYLFICRPYLQTDMVEVLERLGAPKRYAKKIIAPPLPKNVTESFIANLSLKEGIETYAGNYDAEVIAMAKKLDVWDKPFDRGVTALELLAEGFYGEALGLELDRRTQEKIKSLKEK